MFLNSTLKDFSSPSRGLGRVKLLTLSCVNNILVALATKRLLLIPVLISCYLIQFCYAQNCPVTTECNGSYIPSASHYDENSNIVTNDAPDRSDFLTIRNNNTHQDIIINRNSAPICSSTIVLSEASQVNLCLTFNGLQIPQSQGSYVMYNIYRSNVYRDTPQINCSGLWQTFESYFGEAYTCGLISPSQPCTPITMEGFYYISYIVYNYANPNGSYIAWFPFFYVRKNKYADIVIDDDKPSVLCGSEGSTVLRIRNLIQPNERIVWYKDGLPIADGRHELSTLEVTQPGKYRAFVCSPEAEIGYPTICCPKPFSNEIEITFNNNPPDFTLVQNIPLEGCNPEQIIPFELTNISCPNQGQTGCSATGFYTFGNTTENISIPNDRFNVNVLNTPGTITVIMTDAVGCQTTKTINIIPVEGCCPALPARGANFGTTTISSIRSQGGINPSTMNRNSLQFSGILTIDRNVTFTDMNLTFGPNARIVMNGDFNLIFQGCNLNCCNDQMWKGINASAGNVRLINGTTLACAEVGLTLSQTARTTVNSSTLDRNNDHIVINRVPNPVTLDNATFSCSAPLVAPFGGQTTKRAIVALGGGQGDQPPLTLNIGGNNAGRNNFSGCYVAAIEARNYHLRMINNTIDLNGNSIRADGILFVPYEARPVSLIANTTAPRNNIIRNVRHGFNFDCDGATSTIINIQNCNIRDASQSGINVAGRNAIDPNIESPTDVDVVIRQNTIANCSTGISMSRISARISGNNFNIVNNPEISGCLLDGIRITDLYLPNNATNRVNITGNTIWNVQRDGIRIQDFSTELENPNGQEKSINIISNSISDAGLAPLFIPDPFIPNQLIYNSIVGGGIYIDGVQFRGSGPINLNIRGNGITSFPDASQPMYYGIFTDAPRVGNLIRINIEPQPGNEGGPNHIEGVYRGIVVTNGGIVSITNNEIINAAYRNTFPDEPFRLRFLRPCGISLIDRRQVAFETTIRDNNIIAYNAPNADNDWTGIFIRSSFNNILCHNTINGFTRAIAVQSEPNIFTRFQLNELQNYMVGVNLVSSSTLGQGIGAQYNVVSNGTPNDPRWRVQTWNNEFIPRQNNSIDILTQEYQGQQRDMRPRILWATQSYAPYRPFISLDANNNQDCDRFDACSVLVRTPDDIVVRQEVNSCGGAFREVIPPDGLVIPGNRRWKFSEGDVNKLIGIAQIQLNEPLIHGADYIAKQQLYDILSIRTDLRTNIAVLDSFYNAAQVTNIARLYNVSSAIEDALKIPVTRTVPCLPPSATDSVSVSCPIKNALRTSALNQAMALNDAIVPNNIAELNEKLINTVEINQFLNFTRELTPSQETIVREVAQQCVRQGGRAVIRAKRMFFVRERYDVSFTDTCDIEIVIPQIDPQMRQDKVTENINPKPTFELYPNPAQTECTVSYRLPEGVTAVMKVYAASGQELGTWALKDRENVITLNTAPWAAGIYMTHFIASDGTLSIQKLVIVN